MIVKRELIFWLVVWLVLTLLFSSTVNHFMVSFYFVTILMPVVMATSLFFNRFLVPNYLLMEKRWRFTLYFTYMLIVSIYLELLVMVLAFVILADYQIDNLGKIAGDIYLMTVILYLVVLIQGLILTVQKLREKSSEIEEIQQKLSVENKTDIAIRSNRKEVLLQLGDILYVESLGDYVKIHSLASTYVTKEKISSLNERLPETFVRVHRSFIVNKSHVTKFNKEEIVLGERAFPIGRKYRKSSEDFLKRNTIA